MRMETFGPCLLRIQTLKGAPTKNTNSEAMLRLLSSGYVMPYRGEVQES